ncbi:MAG: gluconeogenesis factor YvcK family protein [Patescibacteria group bacterium]
MSIKNVVIIGGGTGTFVTLSALKNYPVKLKAIVSMIDSGGSTGRLRDQLGVLPPGDVRQALVALSDESKIWRDLFTYRFENGDLNGHTFGNIFLSTIEKMAGSLPEAIKVSQKLLKTKGDILPVTLDKSTLYAKLSDGTVVEGEAKIDVLGEDWKSPVRKISKCWISPKAYATKESLKAIEVADFIIIGPGDLHTSILPNFLVDGMARAITKSTAKKIFVVNLMTKRGQTDGFKASNFITELKKISRGLVFDYILINNGKVEKSVVGWYKKTCEVGPVVNDLTENKRTKVIPSDTVGSTKYGKTISDRIQRSLIRHDPEKLGKALIKIILG